MSKTATVIITLAGVALGGCFTPPNVEKGANGTMAYYVRVESSTPGVSIETNGVFAGKTPLTLRIFGDKDGTFHDFGGGEYTICALPLNTNQFLQSQTFSATHKSSPGSPIPGFIFFEMSAKAGSFSLDIAPEK